MSAKTKIVVLHLKELIYTGIFVGLGILFLILLVIMFLPRKKQAETDTPQTAAPSSEEEAVRTSYIPGVYATSLVLSNHSVDVEVTVDADCISSVRLVNLDEAVTTMYPLLAPSFDAIAEQLCTTQSLEHISYSDENKYTTLVLLEAVRTSLEKAEIILDVEEDILP